MAEIDWSRFSHKIYLNAGIRRVYDAWATRANIESWFLRKGEFKTPDGKLRGDLETVQKGDTYEWLWHGHPDSTVEHGVVTEANGKDRFAFVFGTAGVVTITLREVEPNVTEMILVQDQIPTDDHGKFSYHVGCSTGWSFYEGNIKSILEGGMDLRNKNPNYTNVINS
jgi:uncharacterized protein YndB with AHSA1/START domain